MAEHYRYLVGLLEQGRLVLASPSLDPAFGIIVLEATTEEDAWRLVRAGPSVLAGIQTPELHPFRVSLLRGREPG